ncbi:thiamine diphosphokinase [Alteribacillus sp. HJP-4]|uniref:thiamine diphosphokinase n=1 Tax=Alteribacillus sp. HJP-4 TaxID=2775394 RepID=UPI0035CCCBEB
MKTLLFGGGTIESEAYKVVNDTDILIGVDRGAHRLIMNGFYPDIALGDFDSVSKEELITIQENSKQVMQCDAVNKNQSDMELGLEAAAGLPFSKVLAFGALGSRFDHSLTNIFLLERALELGLRLELQNNTNIIQLTDSSLNINANSYPYVSLLPLSEIVEGVSIKGFYYPLENATLKRSSSLGVSNKMIEKTAAVFVKKGRLLVIQSSDQ